MAQQFEKKESAAQLLKEVETKCTVTNHVYEGVKNLTGIKSFDCGNEVINKFVKKNLKAKAKAVTSVVTVLLDEANDNKLVGFYTASSHKLERDAHSMTGLFSKAPRDVPVVRLEMLGVDKSYQKQGFGEELVALAMEKTAVVAKAIGCYGLYLDADKDAVDFYKKLGFQVLGEPCETYGSYPMFLHINVILNAL
ncbi:TPA: GNAT family N-acetyltransferase [Vibrio parahaemolyticus]|nr:GNAT family N-acetyltransferase [Vibrio parahaemolyticus]EJC7970399.1 GNAT family N-acetyltransferase [Vibrio parahaemolyticus]ELA9213932.1 GNAT family N-acetyltransferase [Vibrio parahaemolyticus]ELH3776929.1 GNAT family N-acetyltransferase [Vibrio parahaemolyticus]HCG9125857.1 GNAT family N-acetyltransferase [Vibrio parahaemolyticus]